MRRWPTGLVYLMLFLFAGCGGREVLQLSPETGWEGWKVTDWKEGSGGSRTVTWRRKDATRESPPEWVTYQILPKPDWDSPDTTMNKLKALIEQRCPGGVWHVIRQDASAILYEGKVANCPRDPDEVDIARIIYGEKEMVQLAYTAQATELSPAHRDEAIRLLMGARLESSPDPRAAPQGQSPRLPGSGGGRRRGGGGGS
jgi:hypothetical protein